MRWKILPQTDDDLEQQLLINRKIKTAAEKEQFFHPKLSDWEKDLNISGIEKAVQRIKQAIKKNELIIVYGDYDVDGICASAILYKGLISLGAKVLPYIPHREKEGYGLSKIGLEFAKDSMAGLVITVDNGITASEAAKFGKSLGLDLIITDHHLPGKQLPEAYEIVHSTKMCGAAVAWCLIRNSIDVSLAKELLQFAAMATVCDVMPLLGLGRTFLTEGLEALQKTTNPGLISLINECSLNLGEIGSYEIGHILGPRLNAMGRLEHAIDSLRLLCTKDPLKAKKLSALLCQTNATRQQMTMDAVKEAKALLTADDNINKIHVLHSETWASGIIGLIAGKIVEEFNRPAIAISVGEEIAKGSARSTKGVNIVEVIRRHIDLLIDVGGHPGAAGFSLLPKNVALFKKRLQQEIIELELTEKVLEIEAQVPAKSLTGSLVQLLNKFEPFGFENPRPVLATKAMLLSDIRTVGEGKHLKGKADGIDFIGFGMGQLKKSLQNGQQVDIAYNLELDNYNGFEKLQLKIKDIVVK